MDQDKLNIIELHGISIVFSSMSIISSVITKFRIGQESEYSWESFSVQKRRERTESPSTKTSIKVPRSATIARQSKADLDDFHETWKEDVESLDAKCIAT